MISIYALATLYLHYYVRLDTRPQRVIQERVTGSHKLALVGRYLAYWRPFRVVQEWSISALSNLLLH